MKSEHRASRSIAAFGATLLLAVAACGSDSASNEQPGSTPEIGSTATAPIVPGTAPDVASPSDSAPPSDSTVRDASRTTGLDVSVTASGGGGCIDAVQISSLTVDERTEDATDVDDVWATFDLVLDNNCGDPGLTVVFERPSDGVGSQGWRRTAAGGDTTEGGVSVNGPVCDDRIECTDAARTVDLTGPVEHVVGFELRTSASDDVLVGTSPYEIPVTAIYDYATDRLEDAPIEIVLTIRVGDPSPVPSGDTTPIDTGRRPVTVLAAGFDLLTFPVAAFADGPGDLATIFEQTDAVDPDALGIDWSRDAVVVFAIPTDLCPPVLTGLDIADGVASAVFENPGYRECEQPLLSHTVIAAVDRELFADVGEIGLAPDDPYFDVRASALVDATAPTGATPEPAAMPDFGAPVGSGVLPAAGEVVVVELDDGAPVYVVAHRDGTVSALDPRAGAPLEAPDGISGLVRWNAANRNFMGRGVWDEYGRRVDGFRATDMIGRATRVIDRNGEPIVEIGATVAAPVGSPIALTTDPPAMADAAVDLDGAVALDDALGLPVGSTAVIDATIVVDPDGAFICVQEDPGFGARCPAGSPALDGGSAVVGFRSVYFGPLLGTRSETGFARVAATGGTSGQSL